MSKLTSPTSMWADACALLEEADRLHRQFFRPGSADGSTPVWEAPADVFEHGHEVTVWVALPGVPAEAVDVSLAGDVVQVRGRRRLRLEPASAVIRRLEIPHGRFERRVELPRGEYVMSGCETADGCVRLSLRRR